MKKGEIVLQEGYLFECSSDLLTEGVFTKLLKCKGKKGFCFPINTRISGHLFLFKEEIDLCEKYHPEKSVKKTTKVFFTDKMLTPSDFDLWIKTEGTIELLEDTDFITVDTKVKLNMVKSPNID